ncbi:hypothetical protein JDN40_00370 [Rhodomicrobium vannielii ATCC 17100]|uniref:ankyrin repeat domain-containing protein n=1 Tax=Rhodomicrobium vannielii TaxID=1069 RepID=UPI0019185BFB|nr:hypothetical protein [Rhodomicrobium vannielii]MBJ7532595.1 hypothetical protein [Rhodomicrobium vannielii ATCC 17100]
MRAVIAAVLSLFGVTMSQAEDVEGLIFERPPYKTAAEAITAGDTATLRRLIAEGLDVNYEGRETETPWAKDTVTLLLWAILKEQSRCIEMLVEAGADVNKGSRAGFTPLMMSLAKSDRMFDLILDRYRPDPNKLFAGRRSALMQILGEFEMGDERFKQAERLVAHGADIDLDLDRGETALIQSSKLEYWQNVLWLLEHGADYEKKGRDYSAVDWLQDSYETGALKPSALYDYRNKVRDWLLARGVDRSRIDPRPKWQRGGN